MRSTGEVMGVGESFGIAFAKAQLAAGTRLPDHGSGLHEPRRPRQGARDSSWRDSSSELGFTIAATVGTAGYLRAHGVDGRHAGGQGRAGGDGRGRRRR